MVKALIIIDMAKSYELDTYNAKEILDNQLKLINTFHKQNLPIILVGGKKDNSPNPVMLKLWGNEDEENERKGLNELMPELLAAPHTKRINKGEYDAFFQTDLEEYCKKENIDELYLCGVYSGVCVYFTGAGAAMRRIQPYLITDAASTEQKSWHKDNCEKFKTVLGPLITTEELIQELGAKHS